LYSNSIFDLVTFDPGEKRDLGKVRLFFIEEAVLVLRISREGNTTFDVDGYVADWESFIASQAVKERGFEEKIIRLKPMVLGEMTQMLVLYEADLRLGRNLPRTVFDYYNFSVRGSLRLPHAFFSVSD
jgi:hypothetical protein